MTNPIQVSKPKAYQPDFVFVAVDGTVTATRLTLAQAADALTTQPEGATIAALVAVLPHMDEHFGNDLDYRMPPVTWNDCVAFESATAETADAPTVETADEPIPTAEDKEEE